MMRKSQGVAGTTPRKPTRVTSGARQKLASAWFPVQVPYQNGVVQIDRETPHGISQSPKEEATMSQKKFPAGWDEAKVRRVLAHYEEQTEDDALLEDEAGIEPSETVMNVPRDLVATVRELIAKRRN